MSRIYLNVPFIEKEQAKALGARYDITKSSWYVEDDRDLSPFQKWLNTEYSTLVGSKTQQNSASGFANIQSQPLLSDGVSRSMSLAELLLQVSNTVQAYHSTAIWVRAEIASYSQHNGHHYLTLIHREKDTAQEVAKVQAHIWRSKEYIIKNFEKNTKQTLNESIKILVKCRVKLHIQYGLSLEILEIDDSYTLGHFMQKISQIRNRLQQQSVITNNKNLPARESVINHVAVISPMQAAGLADFNYMIEPIVNAKLLKCEYFQAVFQGSEAPQSIVSALEKIQKSKKSYQVIIIIRGGGSITDLQYLEDYSLLEKVCLSSIPIWVGVGHEIDYMTIDEVANQSFITPTALANHLLKSVLTPYEEAKKLWQYCFNRSLLLVNSQRQILTENNLSNKLIGLAKFRVGQERVKMQQIDLFFQKANNVLFLSKQKLNQVLQLLQIDATYRISYYRNTLKHQQLSTNRTLLQHLSYQRKSNEKLMKAIGMKLPTAIKSTTQQLNYYQQIISQNHWQKILKKGYAIVRDMDGKVVSQFSKLHYRKKYSLQMKDGRIFFNIVRK